MQQARNENSAGETQPTVDVKQQQNGKMIQHEYEPQRILKEVHVTYLKLLPHHLFGRTKKKKSVRMVDTEIGYLTNVSQDILCCAHPPGRKPFI
jgi:hypothetical protein